MNTLRFSGLVFVSLAMFALPAAAQTPDGITPANEGICDEEDFVTPGLYGLCVAMCEAQDCEAEYDSNAGQVVYNPSCSPSSEALFNNYRKIYEKRGDPEDPSMPPCVKVACPCWTELELDNIAGPSASCAGAQPDDIWAFLMGSSTDGPGREWAFVSKEPRRGFMCTSMEQNPNFHRDRDISKEEYDVCLPSVKDECSGRGLITP